MPMLKTISGHTSTKGIRRYLTKKNRALAEDCLNLDPPEPGRAFDWARRKGRVAAPRRVRATGRHPPRGASRRAEDRARTKPPAGSPPSAAPAGRRRTRTPQG